MIDVARAAADFRAQGELLYLAGALPDARLAELRGEAERLDSTAVRVHVPLVRSGGTVGARRLRREAPAMTALYRELVALVAEVSGRELWLKEEDDDHGFALYSYRGGDFMRLHHDRCGAAPHGSYSITVGIVNDSTSRLDCRLDGGQKVALATAPGSFTIYNGTRVLHGVTRLGPGERRLVLSGSYRTQKDPDPLHHRIQQVTNGLLYFGLRRHE